MPTSINTFLSNPEKNSDSCFNFYDWFCNESSLRRRMNSLVPKLRYLVKEGILNGDTHYVWFKNNCPMSGGTYDDIRISSLNEDNDFVGGFSPNNGRDSDRCQVWTIDGELETFDFDNWMAFKKAVKTDPEFKAMLTNHFGK